MSNFFSRLFCGEDKDLSKNFKSILKDIVADQETMINLGKLFRLWHGSFYTSLYLDIDQNGVINKDGLKNQLEWFFERLIASKLGEKLIDVVDKNFDQGNSFDSWNEECKEVFTEMQVFVESLQEN
jgi:hypothetical protein